MTPPRRRLTLATAPVLLLALLLAAATAMAQVPRALVVGGDAQNFGRHDLTGSFMPDPLTVRLRSGGNLDVPSMNLGPDCRGFVTAEPDVIIRYTDPARFLRFFVRSTAGDTTLVVRTPDGRWLCNDDAGGGVNPMVDVNRPPAGQYDVWVGSYRADQMLESTLYVTEMRTRRP